MTLEARDMSGITWCTSSLTTASNGTSIFHRTSGRGRFSLLGRTVVLQAIYLGGRNTRLAEWSRYRPRAALRNDGKCEPCGRADALTRAAITRRSELTIMPIIVNPSPTEKNPPTMRRKATFALLRPSLRDRPVFDSRAPLLSLSAHGNAHLPA
jgi:hypothetical protein